MNRIGLLATVLLVVLAPGPPALAQHGDVQQRVWREQAVAVYGPVARDIVETHGTESVRALFACSMPVGLQLCEFHNRGLLGKLPRPPEALRAIGQSGDVTAWFVMQHHRELQDLNAFDAFILAPTQYSLNLRSLEAGAAEVRAQRLQAAMRPEWNIDVRTFALVGGVLGLIALFLWRRRRHQTIAGAA